MPEQKALHYKQYNSQQTHRRHNNNKAANTNKTIMAYQLPLSERIRIQFEILGENCADCFASLSGSYKNPMIFLASCAVILTLRSAKKSIAKVKMSGGYGASSYTSGYGTSSYGAASSLTGGSSLYGGYGSGGSTGAGLMGGSSPSYGVRGTSPMSSGYGTSSSYGSNLGTSSFGSTMGGSTMGVRGKGTSDLVDTNPNGVIALDPSIRFFDYGGSTDFYGQIEVVQAFDAASFVTQILSQPGHSKVLVVDGGGSYNSALFDSEMANTAMRNGWKGVVVNGAVRNSGQLSKTQFGVKALGTNPLKGRSANGQQGAIVTIGSTQLQSGLWLYADSDGIVISQSDVSGGSFGSGSSLGSSFGTGGIGTTSSLTGGYSSSSLTGGYGSSSSSNGGYGSPSSSTGGYSGTINSMGSSLTGGYGAGTSTGYGSSSYGGSSSMGYSSGYGSSSPYSYGRSSYSYSSKKNKHKMFKILLATSIAAIVWIVCLR